MIFTKNNITSAKNCSFSLGPQLHTAKLISVSEILDSTLKATT